jgi:DNA-binding NarL/FixJ family response regulator
MDRPVRVVIADDECLFRASLRHLLSVPPSVVRDVYACDVGVGFDVVGEAGSGEETLRVVHAIKPDLLLLDLCMPRLSGIDVVRELSASGACPPAIILAGSIERGHLSAALHAGVQGLVVKDVATSHLFEAMACVAKGGSWLDRQLVSELIEVTRPLLDAVRPTGRVREELTRRERQVLDLVIAGYQNKDIARVCSLSEHTVKHHLTRMFDKLGATNRTQLAMMAGDPAAQCQPA